MTKFNVTLAHKRSDKLDVTEGVYIQPKLDGVRCYTKLVDGEIKMFSRNHKEFMNCEHIKTELNEFFRNHPNVVLDGELYNHKYRDNFNRIISLVRKTKPTQADKFQAASHMQYHVYDMYSYTEYYHKYEARNNFLKNMFLTNKFRSIKPVKTILLYTEDAVKRFHAENLHDGYEGSMLRANEVYQQRRSHGLQKVKDFHDTEFTITGFVEGKGKFEGGLGKFLGKDEAGREIEVPWQKLKMADRRAVWKDRKFYLGKVATFEYFERTPDGAYRFPQFKCIRDYEG